MRAYNSMVMDRRVVARLVFCVVALLAGIAAASAAEMKSGGGLLGPSQGTVGGGVIGSNRGGAGGVSNPEPGGSAGSFGGPGASAGPRATTSSRPGYLGGRVDETVPGEPTVTEVSTIINVQQLGQCDLSTRSISPDQRLAGGNRQRLQYGSSIIAPKAGGRYRGSRHVMLASYQEELGKGTPDVVLAGTYLGIVAETPVTARSVSDLSNVLCVPVSADMADRIAAIAEAQREKLAAEAQADANK